MNQDENGNKTNLDMVFILDCTGNWFNGFIYLIQYHKL